MLRPVSFLPSIFENLLGFPQSFFAGTNSFAGAGLFDDARSHALALTRHTLKPIEELLPHTAECRGNPFEGVSWRFQSLAEEPFQPNLESLDAVFRREMEISFHVHDLMVAVHGDDPVATSRYLALQRLEEVEDLELFFAAVEDVADLDHGGGAPNVAVRGSDQIGEAQHLPQLLEHHHEIC